MRSQLLNMAVAAPAALFLAGGNHAMPTGLSTLHRRGYQGVSSLIDAVYEALQDRDAYASDIPDKCNIEMRTTDGGNCQVQVFCSDDRDAKGIGLDANQVCYVGGQQYLTHPKLGDFSITYTKAGGVDGNKQDGLHNPVIQMANLNNWESIDVQQIIDNQKGQDAGRLCKTGGLDAISMLAWTCALPEVGTAGFGISNFPAPDGSDGFTPGWCTMHVDQHQRNEFGVGNEYEFDVIIYDGAGKEVGATQLAAIDATSKTLSVTSKLPYTVEIIAAGDDHVAVTFKYGDQTWSSDDGSHQSTFGNGKRHGFENGNREGDMGFNC